MAFHFDDVAKLAALNRLFRRQEAAVEATVLIRRDGQPFAFRQCEECFRFSDGRGEGFFYQHVFTRLERAFRIVEMAVGMGTDDDQFNLRVAQDFIEIAGEMNMGILRRLLFRLRAAAVDMRHMPAVFTVENIRKVIAGRTFTKSNKCAM